MSENNKKGSNKILYGILFLMIGLIIGASATSTSNTKDLPSGVIIMYKGDYTMFDTYGWLLDDNYSGWHLCNGLNQTLDMSGCVPVGYNYYEDKFDDIGEKMGNNSYTMTIDQMPYHEHTYLDIFHRTTGRSLSNGLATNAEGLTNTIGNTNGVGSGAKIDNMQKSIVVSFIQKVY